MPWFNRSSPRLNRVPLAVAILLAGLTACERRASQLAIIVDNSASVSQEEEARQEAELAQLVRQAEPGTRILMQPLPAGSAAEADALPLLDIRLPHRYELDRSRPESERARVRALDSLAHAVAVLRSRPPVLQSAILEAIQLATARLAPWGPAKPTTMIVFSDGLQDSGYLRITRRSPLTLADAKSAGKSLTLNGVCVVLSGVSDEKVARWWKSALQEAGAREIVVGPQLAYVPSCG